MNNYLKEYLACGGADLDKRYIIPNKRHTLVHKFSWAIPTPDVIQRVSEYSPLVEIGAGTGYWASLLAVSGTRVMCFDKYLGDENPYKHTKSWYPVYGGDETVLQKFSPSVNLFLCWPPYDEPMAANCLKQFKGRYVVYIGESSGGCNASDEFFDLLNNEWLELASLDIPQWWGIHDYVWIYKRRLER